MKPTRTIFAVLWTFAVLCTASLVWADEPDHAIHEELRGVLHEVVASINSAQYDKMLPYLTENIEATSVTQEVMPVAPMCRSIFRRGSGRPATCVQWR